MREYDCDIECGIHTVRITLQLYGYVGRIVQRIFGTGKGRRVLGFDFEQFDEGFCPKNDCQLKCDDGWFECVLRDEGGDSLEVEGTAEEMNKLIVGTEIIDFSPGK